ncbi:MAG: hypothetical protein AAF799_33245 [Myxococcota bacterium]
MASLLRQVRVEDLGEPVPLPPWPGGDEPAVAASAGGSAVKLVLLGAVVLGAGVFGVVSSGDGERPSGAPTSTEPPGRRLAMGATEAPVAGAAAPRSARPVVGEEADERQRPAVDVPPRPSPDDATAPQSGRAPRPARSRPRPSTPAAESDPPSTSSAELSATSEVELVAEMRASLPREPSRALKLAREGEQRFPKGMFVRERRAYEIFSLHALGRTDEAATLARRFARRYPSGPLSERVAALVSAPASGSEPSDRAQQ